MNKDNLLLCIGLFLFVGCFVFSFYMKENNEELIFIKTEIPKNANAIIKGYCIQHIEDVFCTKDIEFSEEVYLVDPELRASLNSETQKQYTEIENKLGIK